jgi:hypothetical protein
MGTFLPEISPKKTHKIVEIEELLEEEDQEEQAHVIRPNLFSSPEKYSKKPLIVTQGQLSVYNEVEFQSPQSKQYT